MHGKLDTPPLDAVLGSANAVAAGRLAGAGPAGRLPLTPEMLREEPSGNVFGLTQNVGMGWSPASLNGPQYVIVSTHGGLRSEDGSPVALGYHTGHWEIGLLVRGAAETLRAAGAIPFAAYCSDPCDGRTQGTTGMFDSLPYRNDAAVVMRRLIRSLPTASGVIGVATCDKGLPATMLALAGCRDLPGVIVPGGVTLPARGGEDAGQVQSLGARFARDLVSLDYAATMGCRACGSAGGGCQFLGAAATSQGVAEALGLALPHNALAPSGEPGWVRLRAPPALPPVMLHLRRMGLLHGDVLTATGDTLDATLDWWEASERRRAARARLAAAAAVAPDDVIMGPDAARGAGLTSTVVFPVGNLAPEGAVIKATALDPAVVGDDQIYRHRGPARVFVDERDAIRAVKGATERPIRPGDVIVLIGTGPSGTGMQETAQITTALRYLPWGKHVALLTDGRFSGFSSGACVGHIGPEALHGGPIGRVRDDDLIEIVIDRGTLAGSVDLVGAAGQPLDAAACAALLEQRTPHPGLAPHAALPADTRLWAALQRASGGTWAGCVYDVDRIVAALEAGLHLTKERT